MYHYKEVLSEIEEQNPHQEEFLQAVKEVYTDVVPYINDEKVEAYRESAILERIAEPDRIIRFRVTWKDDEGKVHVNRAWRVQFNNSTGPYKGGMRFHPTVNESILKFLGFEQCFKNALTNLPMGGAKGGSDFDPKGKSDDEVFRFCSSMMLELHRYIGVDTDVPAGDIGVGNREISYLFGQYKKMTNKFTGTLTGKGIDFGGSLIRTEATGYGLVYFTDFMLQEVDEDLEGKKVLISGSGNVALYACEKAIEKGAKVISMSDSDGTIYDKDGIDEEKLKFIKDLKKVRRGRISEFADEYDCTYMEGKKPWSIEADIALPCATQNEINKEDANNLIQNGVMLLAEGANMPCTSEATKLFRESDILYAPGKASNAGGVAVSGLEIAQNNIRLNWSADKVNDRLKEIMKDIHDRCIKYGENGDGTISYAKGANIAGFKKVADSMLAFGPV